MRHFERKASLWVLLPWQKFLFAFLCGFFFSIYPVPASVACLLLCSVSRGQYSLFVYVVLFMLGATLSSAPAAPPPGFRKAGLIAGVVEKVSTLPEDRLQILVSQAVDQETHTPLPGKLLWTWEGADYLPVPGESFVARLRVKALRTRVNFGMYASEALWHRRGVLYRAYLRGAQDVYWEKKQVSPRRELLEQVRLLVPQGQSGAVLCALLFGDKRLLEEDFLDRVRRAGLLHSLALSGMHVGLVAFLGVFFAWFAGCFFPALYLKIPRQKFAVVVALPLCLLYMWLGGASASLLRAGVMAILAGFWVVRGRQGFVVDGLFVVLVFFLVGDPWALLSPGLQMSLLAVVGIVLYMPVFFAWTKVCTRWGFLGRMTRWVILLAGTSLCATLFLCPVLAGYFGGISPHLYWNIFWLPVLGFWVLPGAFSGLLATVCGACGLAEKLFFGAGFGVFLLQEALGAADNLGFLFVVPVLRPLGLQILGIFILLGTAPFCWRNSGKCLPVFYGLCLLFGPLLFHELRGLGRLEMTVLDTGMSQAVCIRTPGGKAVLVDGGGSWSSAYDVGERIVGPALTYGHRPLIDVVLLTHLDSDHVRGLFFPLRTFFVGWFGASGLDRPGENSARLEQIFREKPVQKRRLRAGQKVLLEPDIWLEVLAPAEEVTGISENHTSLVVRLVWAGKGLALIPGDADKKALVEVAEKVQVLQAEVLVLPHHGSGGSYAPYFFRRVAPEYAVAACGPGNHFGFPRPEIVRLCRRIGAQVLSTAEHGAVRFIWKKDQALKVQTARNFRGMDLSRAVGTYGDSLE